MQQTISYSIIRVEITKLKDVDVIVNAASDTLFHGAGVCGSIHRAAGNELDKECQQYIKDHGPLPVSGVATTGSYNLSKQGIKKIVHAVGPVFDKKNPKQSELELEKAIKNVLKEVFDKLKLKSVAIPAISSGTYGFPQKLCAEVFLRTIPKDKKIILCIYEEDTYNIFRDVFKVEQQKNSQILPIQQFEKIEQSQLNNNTNLPESSQQSKIAMIEAEIVGLKQTIYQQQLAHQEVDKQLVSIQQENISLTNLNREKNFVINQLEQKILQLAGLDQSEIKEVSKLKEQRMEQMDIISVSNYEIKELKDENVKLKSTNNEMKQTIETLSQKFDPSNVVKGNLINVNQGEVSKSKISQQNQKQKQTLQNASPQGQIEEIQNQANQVLKNNSNLYQIEDNDKFTEKLIQGKSQLNQEKVERPTQQKIMASDSIIREDITKLEDVDVIVNAASDTLFHGAGVCGSIHRAAGNELDKECQQYIKDHGPLPVSGVATTGSHNLSKQGIKKIVHAVGPVFDNYNPKQSELELEQLIKNVLNEVFVELKLNSVAIPAISSGTYGFPKKLCAEVFKRTIPKDKKIILCIYEEDTYNIFRDVFDEENKKDQSQKQQVLDQKQQESEKEVQYRPFCHVNLMGKK